MMAWLRSLLERARLVPVHDDSSHDAYAAATTRYHDLEQRVKAQQGEWHGRRTHAHTTGEHRLR